MKLRNKILLALLLIGLPLVAINSWWIAGQQGRERQRVIERLRQEAEGASAMVQVFFSDLADRGQQTALHVPADASLRDYLKSRLAYLRWWNMGITGLAWTDAEGRVLAGEPAELFTSGVRVVGRETLRAVRGKRGWALDALVMEEDGGRSLGSLRMVARDANGTFRGAVGIRLRPEIFRPLFPSRTLWAQIRLADPTGRLVYATDRTEPTLDECFAWAEMPGLRETLSRGAETAIAGRVPGDRDGKEWMAAHAPIPQIGWVATALIPAADALRESQRTLYGQIAIQAALVALCTGAALILAHRVAWPARRLADTARRIAAGDTAARVALTGRDELAELGCAFDEMADSLDASLRVLAAERDAAHLVSSTLDSRRVFDFIAEAASKLLDGAAALLLVADGDAGPLRIRASHGIRRAELRTQDVFHPGEGLPGWVFQQRKPLVLDDAPAGSRTLNRAWVDAEGLRAFAGVPLVQRDRCLGVLVAMRAGGRPFALRDVDMLKSFASHAATAIENARLYERAEAEGERLRAVLEAMPAAVVVGEGRPQERTFRLVMGNRVWAELQRGPDLMPGARTPHYEVLRPDGSPMGDGELPLQRAVWWGEATKEMEVVLRYADGSQRLLLVTVVPFPETAGVRQAVGMMLDITGRRQAEEELKRLVADNAALYEQAAREAQVKGLLLDELNHRVRNNLSLIASFLELQRATPGGRVAAPALEDAIARVKGLALVHNVLAGKCFEGGEYGVLARGLAEQTLCRGPLAGRVEVRVADGSLRLSSKALTALGIVTNELFTNIAKHAFPDGRRGRVEVTVEATGPEVAIRVRDDGGPLPPGFEEGPGHLGLRLIRSLVEVSLRGSFTLEAGAGTTAVIRFPLPESAEALV